MISFLDSTSDFQSKLNASLAPTPVVYVKGLLNPVVECISVSVGSFSFLGHPCHTVESAAVQDKCF